MSKIEQLANELAFLTNANMAELSRILVRDYPTRADVLETQITTQFYDQQHTKELA